jgi:hypothetical protein
MGFNRRQLRAIGIALERYHRFLDALEPLLDQWANSGDADPEAVAAIRGMAQRARHTVAYAMASLGIQHEAPDSRMWALAQLTALWATLEDLQPSKLRRYGEVDAQAAGRWQGMLNQLRSVTSELIAQLQRLGQPPGGE